MNIFKRRVTAGQLRDAIYRDLDESVLKPSNYAHMFEFQEDGYRFELAIASAVENYVQKYVHHQYPTAFEKEFYARMSAAMVDRFKDSPVETSLAMISFYPPERIAVCGIIRMAAGLAASEESIYSERAPLWQLFEFLQMARASHFQVEVANARSQGLVWPDDVALAITICAPFWVFGGPVQKKSEAEFFGAALLKTIQICQNACARLASQ